jgi:hypothetical protein
MESFFVMYSVEFQSAVTVTLLAHLNFGVAYYVSRCVAVDALPALESAFLTVAYVYFVSLVIGACYAERFVRPKTSRQQWFL